MGVKFSLYLEITLYGTDLIILTLVLINFIHIYIGIVVIFISIVIIIGTFFLLLLYCLCVGHHRQETGLLSQFNPHKQFEQCIKHRITADYVV